MSNPPTLYLARHATPDWSRTDLVYHLPPGPPLAPKGHSEAAELGAFLRTAEVAQIWASPMERCWHTARIAAEALGRAPQEDQRLMEWQPTEKEPDVLARLQPALAQARLADGPVLLLTHGGPVAVLLAHLGLDEKVLAHYRTLFDRRNPLPPAGVWRAIPTTNGWELNLAFTPKEYQKALWV